MIGVGVLIGDVDGVGRAGVGGDGWLRVYGWRFRVTSRTRLERADRLSALRWRKKFRLTSAATMKGLIEGVHDSGGDQDWFLGAEFLFALALFGFGLVLLEFEFLMFEMGLGEVALRVEQLEVEFGLFFEYVLTLLVNLILHVDLSLYFLSLSSPFNLSVGFVMCLFFYFIFSFYADTIKGLWSLGF